MIGDEGIKELLPHRSLSAIETKRRQIGVLRKIKWLRGEDEELRLAAKIGGPSAVKRRLPHRTVWEINERAKELRISFYKKPINVIGHPVIDAIRQRAVEDGIGVKALDRELGGVFFQSDAALRQRLGHRQDMKKIRQALDFFDAKLITNPDGSEAIDWQDE